MSIIGKSVFSRCILGLLFVLLLLVIGLGSIVLSKCLIKLLLLLLLGRILIIWILIVFSLIIKRDRNREYSNYLMKVIKMIFKYNSY